MVNAVTAIMVLATNVMVIAVMIRFAFMMFDFYYGDLVLRTGVYGLPAAAGVLLFTMAKLYCGEGHVKEMN